MNCNYKKFEREMVNKEIAYRIKRGEVPNRKKAIKTFRKLFTGIYKSRKKHRFRPP